MDENKAIVPATQTVLRKLSDYNVKGAFFSPTELVLDAGMEEAQWMQVCSALSRVCQSSSWWTGDAINYGAKTYGYKTAYDLALQSTGWSRSHLYRCARVARLFPPEKRLPDLTFAHYMTVKSFPVADLDRMLPEAANLGLGPRRTYKFLCDETGRDPKQRRTFHRKKLKIYLWTPVYEKLVERAGEMRPHYFVAQIIEEYLTGEKIIREPAKGERTNEWKRKVLEA